MIEDKVIRTHDPNLIKWVLGQGNLWKEFTDDGDGPYSEFNPFMATYVYWLLFIRNNGIIGFARFDLLGTGLYSGNMGILKEFRGKDTKNFGHTALQYMRDHHKAIKFIGLTSNPVAKGWSESLGFKHVHTLKKAVYKDGTIKDIYVMEL